MLSQAFGRLTGVIAVRASSRLDGHGWLRSRTRVIGHEEGGARNGYQHLAARALGTHGAASDAFEIGERGIAVWTGSEPRCCHGTFLRLVVAAPAETTAPAVAAAAGRAFFRLAHVQRPALQLAAVQRADRLLGLGRRA